MYGAYMKQPPICHLIADAEVRLPVANGIHQTERRRTVIAGQATIAVAGGEYCLRYNWTKVVLQLAIELGSYKVPIR
jgi:hypothetical protein